MALVEVKQTMPFGAGGDWAQTFADAETWTESYTVLLDGADAPRDSINVARTSTGVPVKGDVHPTLSSMVVVQVDCNPSDGSFLLFIVIVKYSNTAPTIPEGDDPLSDPWVIDFPESSFKELVTTSVLDVSSLSPSNKLGRAVGKIVNAAGEVFDNPPEEDVFPLLIQCVKNVAKADIDPSEFITYRGSLNDATIAVAGYTIPKWHGRIRMTAKYQDNRGLEYYTLTYNIEIRDTEWIREYLNVGWRYLKSGVLTDCVKFGGVNIQKPVFLNTTGSSHEGIAPIVGNSFLFGTIKEADWSSLTTTPPTTL